MHFTAFQKRTAGWTRVKQHFWRQPSRQRCYKNLVCSFAQNDHKMTAWRMSQDESFGKIGPNITGNRQHPYHAATDVQLEIGIQCNFPFSLPACLLLYGKCKLSAQAKFFFF